MLSVLKITPNGSAKVSCPKYSLHFQIKRHVHVYTKIDIRMPRQRNIFADDRA